MGIFSSSPGPCLFVLERRLRNMRIVVHPWLNASSQPGAYLRLAISTQLGRRDFPVQMSASAELPEKTVFDFELHFIVP